MLMILFSKFVNIQLKDRFRFKVKNPITGQYSIVVSFETFITIELTEEFGIEINGVKFYTL